MMAETFEQLSNGTEQSSLIPKGREQDYREADAPEYSFLDMVIDEKNCYVGPLAITSASEDRDGEITNPDGLIDVAYRTNPVVFLQHSHRVMPLFPPVGTAETPDRTYDLMRDGQVWKSGCRFTQKLKSATQTFALVADGVIRGRSIGALNHAMSYYKPQMPGVAFHQNTIIPVRTKSVSHDKYELIEWSWVFIPSNRDMVTPVKSILSNDRLDGQKLDGSLKMMMKSFDLAEPVSNAQHSSRPLSLRYGSLFKSSFRGGNTVESPAEILFDATIYGVSKINAFLAKNADLGIVETPLESVTINGQRFLKSTQFIHKGPFESIADPMVPGLQIMMAKAAPEEEATGKIQQLVADPEAGKVVVTSDATATPAVDQKAAPAPGAAPAAAAPAAAPAEAAAVVEAAAEDADKIKGPGGMRYLKALIANLTQLTDMAESASAEQEPEMMEKCGEFTSTLRSFIGKVTEFKNERYGKKDDDGKPVAATDGEEAEEEDEPTAELSKSAKTGLFYGTKSLLPSAFVRGLKVIESGLVDERHKVVLSMMLKGIAIPEEKVDPGLAYREQVRAMMVAAKAKNNIGQLV